MEHSENFFKRRAEELNLSADDVAFQFARLGIQVTSGAVRNWFCGTVPSIEYAEPLAKIFRASKQKMLEVMHEMKLAQLAAAR